MKGANFVMILALLVSVGIFLKVSSDKTDPDPVAAVDPDHPLPMKFKFSGIEPPDTVFMCDVIMSSDVPKDTKLQLYCSKPKLVEAGNGGPFPTSVTIPRNENHALVILHTSSSAKDTTVTIAAGQPGADMSHAENQQASQELIIQDPSVVLPKSHTKETETQTRHSAQ